MILFPNCKINIGLNIVGKREDGFHNLETIFYPVYRLHDALEIIQISNYQEKNEIPIDFTLSGLRIGDQISNNLCIKAYHLLKKDFPRLPFIQMHLHKFIPMGAGLGGGSADGAFTLKLLNEKFNLKLSNDQLINYALQLGSDCPFFIVNNPSFAWERGNMIENINLNLNTYSIILVNPGIHINTGWAFGKIKLHQRKNEEKKLPDLILEPIEAWKESIKNDFEPAVMDAHPIIGDIKSKLYQAGAIYASMSGSGSTVYGIFSTYKKPTEKLFPAFFEMHLSL